MAFLNAYTVYACTLNATIIDQVTARGFQPNPNVQQIMADGEADPTYAAIMNIAPRGTLTTTALNKALLVCGIDGLEITAGLDLWLQKVQPHGVRATGTSHARMTLAKGMLLPRRISAQGDQPATYDLEVIGCSEDGTTAPHSITAGASLTGSPATDEAFTTGPCTLNGTAIDGVQSIEIDFGIEERVEYGNGEPFPRLVYIQTRKPSITITALDAAGLTGSNFQNGQAITTVVVNLLKLTQNGLRAGAGDIICTVNDGTTQIDNIEGDGSRPDLIRIAVTPVFDGTNDVLAFTRST